MSVSRASIPWIRFRRIVKNVLKNYHMDYLYWFQDIIDFRLKSEIRRIVWTFFYEHMDEHTYFKL